MKLALVKVFLTKQFDKVNFCLNEVPRQLNLNLQKNDCFEQTRLKPIQN